ncbi:MAG: dUTP diphosphatase [Oscillospiraceae bacterium]|nr:dUTP diphosphatase [Oscillospiraceae bacterium]
MILPVKKLRDGAVVPVRATPQSAGLDLCACIDEPLTIPAGKTVVVPTGIAIALPENTVGLIYGRSGLGVKHGLTLANAVGVIDSDYRGELLVGIHNHSDRDYTVAPCERIAQLVVSPALFPAAVEVDELGETMRGEGGFGSSGRV